MPQTARLSRLIELMLAMKRALHERLGKKSFPLDPSTLPRLIVLGYVRERGEPTMKEVASFLRITPPSATALINGLVAAKFLERRADHNDRRSVRLRLTPKGKMFIGRRFAEVEEQMEHILGRLTPKEQDLMIHLFEKILV
ncbi:MAG: MarR family transcriptional regulator [Patescibacteria group bacterium]|jgi:DNA-binding MarR family transcriptional regulator